MEVFFLSYTKSSFLRWLMDFMGWTKASEDMIALLQMERQ
jgi:hypothetical protein